MAKWYVMYVVMFAEGDAAPEVCPVCKAPPLPNLQNREC